MAQTLCPLVSAEDRSRLAAIVGDRNQPQKHVARARIVLLSADRLDVAAVARRAGTSRPAVWRWQRRYAEAGVEGLSEFLVGPTALAFSEDPVASAKLMAEFADQVESFALKGGLLEGGRVLGEAEVVALSKLPGREQLLAQIVGGISSPLTGLVTVLNNTVQGLVVALGQIAEQKQSAEQS